MAKDKSTKKDKGEKAAKGTSEASPFKTASDLDGDNWRITEADGRVLVIYPLEVKQVETKNYGESEACVADVVVVNEKNPAKSERHDGTYIFQKWLLGSLRGSVANGAHPAKVCGVLKQGVAKAGQSAPWVLEDPTTEQAAAAVAYLDSLDPFAGQ